MKGQNKMGGKRISIIIVGWLLFAALTSCGKAGKTDVLLDSDLDLPGYGETESEVKEESFLVDDAAIFIEAWDDLDGNGTAEYIKITNTEKGILEFVYNNEVIYKYEEEQERIIGIGEKALVDLDGDRNDEIFVSFYPSVNSMPLVEWFVLKEQNGEWMLLEMYHQGDYPLDNAFPISVFMGKEEKQFIIKCDGHENTISYDATRHYANEELEKEDGDTSFDFFTGQNYQEGDLAGITSDWGIWNIVTGDYEGRNCLVAEHGLNGMSGRDDFFGRVYVYFDYDQTGKIHILNMNFEEADLYYLEQRESEIFDE